eukprot:4462741-Lingulodinium_polyedra.AAC.1
MLNDVVIGIALVKTLYVASTLRALVEEQQQIRRFWQFTKYAAFPLLFVEVLARIELAAPKLVFAD